MSSGWTGLPSFAKSAFGKLSDTTLNLQGSSFGVSYVSYGDKGPDGVLSGRYTLTYDHFHSLPGTKEFTAQNADVMLLDAAEIVTMFPSRLVNLYTGIGLGLGIIHIYHWGPPGPGADPGTVDSLKKTAKTILPLLSIYIPIGISVRIRDFIISAEAGIRDFPYLVGMVTYTFGRERNMRAMRCPLRTSPLPETGKVAGRVIDKASGRPIGRAVVEMKAAGLTDLSTAPLSGAFTTPELKPGKVELYALKDGYVAGAVTVTVNAGQTISTTIPLKRQLAGTTVSARTKTRTLLAPPPVKAVPVVNIERPKVFLEKGKKKIVITESIFFRMGRATILSRSFGLLDEVAHVLQQEPGIKIRIEGYTDNVGSDRVNLRLSQARAVSVMRYLIGKGIAPGRLTAKGFGKANPIASNRTAAGRAKNRRVEFTIRRR